MNQEPETYEVPLKKVLTVEEYEQICRATFPDFKAFDGVDNYYVMALMCAAIKFDRAKNEKDI